MKTPAGKEGLMTRSTSTLHVIVKLLSSNLKELKLSIATVNLIT